MRLKYSRAYPCMGCKGMLFTASNFHEYIVLLDFAPMLFRYHFWQLFGIVGLRYQLPFFGFSFENSFTVISYM